MRVLPVHSHAQYPSQCAIPQLGVKNHSTNFLATHQATRPEAVGSQRAFTLVEMLAVMGVIIVIVALVTPAVTALKGANDVNKAVYDIAGLLQQARAYAMANNTYVYLGVEEVDVTQSAGTTPQTSGNGRVGIAIIAAKDGLRGYDLTSLSSGGFSATTFQTDMVAVGKLQVFENLHLVDLGTPPTYGNMARPTPKPDSSGNPTYNLGDSSCLSTTTFGYPLNTTQGTGQYWFQKVVQFDPQGVPRMQTTANSDTITPRMEIGLEQTHGGAFSTLSPPVSAGQVAAIQIDGVSGATSIYRP